MATTKASPVNTGDKKARRSNGAKLPNKIEVSNDLPCPLVAAYGAGRLWNRLRWHMPQASLTAGGYHHKLVAIISVMLIRAVRITRAPGDRGDIQESLDKIFHDWKNHYDALHVAEEIWNANGELNQLEGEADVETPRRLALERILSPVVKYLERLKEAILGGLDDSQKQAWELGERIDHGLCPPFVTDQSPRMTLNASSQPREPTTFGSTVKKVTQEGNENHLLKQSLRPGDVAPPQFWMAQVQQLFAEMRIAPPFAPTNLNGSQDIDRITAKKLVKQFGDHARMELERVSHQQMHSNGDSQQHKVTTSKRSKTGRDKKQDARDEWIYKQCRMGKAMPYCKIVSNLKEIATKKGWTRISSVQGIRAAARRYSIAHNVGLPPSRIDLYL
ncbi:MAG TPA: hypothetical protein VE988_17935 [Gemmataceae bacterium]|nr:hypothetical protein [Gemmataceae bacterium]